MQLEMKPYVERGEPNSPRRCPIALCLNDFYRDVPNFDHVEVMGNEILVYKKDGSVEHQGTSKGVAEALRYYDQTGEWPKGADKLAVNNFPIGQFYGDPEADETDYRRAA